MSPSATRTPMLVGEGGYGAALATNLGVDHDTFVAAMPKQNGMLTDTLIDPAEIARAVLLLASPTMPSAIGENWAVHAGAVKAV